MEAKIREALARAEGEGGEVDSPQGRPKPFSVLLGDAHSSRGLMTQQLLRQLGKEARIVSDETALISKLENSSRPIELVILTDSIGGMGLGPLISQIRRALPEGRMPVIVTMGLKPVDGLMEFGADDHLRLPLSLTAMRLVLRLMEPS